MINNNFKNLPIDVQEEIKDTLKAYSQVYVSFEYGRYIVSTAVGIKATYTPDHKFLGIFKDTDFYTEDERTANYIECFNSYPAWYEGDRVYPIRKEI